TKFAPRITAINLKDAGMTQPPWPAKLSHKRKFDRATKNPLMDSLLEEIQDCSWDLFIERHLISAKAGFHALISPESVVHGKLEVLSAAGVGGVRGLCNRLGI